MFCFFVRIKDLTCLVCLLLVVTDAGFSQTPVKTTHTIYLGQEKVWLDLYEQPGASITLLNLHDNENTAAEAGKAFIKKHGGRFIELRHGRGREVVVRLDGVLHRFDPNRMFSAEGLRKSLEYFHNDSDDVFAIAAVFRDSVIDLLAAHAGMVLIVLHNNTPDKMTIKDFLPGEWYGKDTREISINPQQDADNFFVVTQNDLFIALDSKGYNVALKAHNPPDRGMAMDYFGRLGVLCVTVETEQDQLAEQTAMLEVLWEIIREKGKKITAD